MPPIIFPELRRPEVVLTPKVLETQHRVFAIHQRAGQMFVISGDAGAGKTTAGRHIVESINQGYAASAANAFSAAYYVAGDLRKKMDTDICQRRFLAEFAKMVLRLTVPKDLRTVCVPGLRSTIAAGLRLSDIQMVFIDEAGHLPPSALDHLVTLINTAVTTYDHPLTVVLIGMDDLPINVEALPQVRRRVVDRVFFEPYDVPTALRVLRVVHPYFATLDPQTQNGAEVMEFLLSKPVSHGGLIGYMVPLVERAAAMAEESRIPYGLRALRLAYAVTEQETQEGRAGARRAWRTAV